MTTSGQHRTSRAGAAALAVATLVGGALLAACGGDGGGSAGTDTAGQKTTASSAAQATVMTTSGDLGEILADGDGKTLYLFAADTGGSSTCSGECANDWPPLLSKGAPKASGGAMADLLGTVAREDGGRQVTYDGHPLYLYARDDEAGEAYGQGSDAFGAKWWAVSAQGKAVTKASDDGGGGYGY